MSSGRASRAKLLGSLLLAAAIFAFLFRRVDVAGVRAEIQEMTRLLPVPVGALTDLGWRWREHRRTAAGAGAVAAVPAEPGSPSG